MDSCANLVNAPLVYSEAGRGGPARGWSACSACGGDYEDPDRTTGADDLDADDMAEEPHKKTKWSGEEEGGERCER